MIDRARYDALKQVVAEYIRDGKVPKSTWTDEILEFERALAPPPPPPPVTTPAAPSPPLTSTPRAAVPLRPGERRPVLVDENMERIVGEVLETWGARFCVFQAAGRLFEIQTDPLSEIEFLICEPTMPRLLQVGSPRARALASRECTFGVEKKTKDGTPEIVQCLPPDWVGGAIVTRPSFDKIHPISALAQAPTLRSDGALIWERGYDASTGIYLAGEIRISVPERPTQDDARGAINALLDLISDFDFSSKAGRSVWIAGLLSLVARHTFNGPAPIIIVDASKRGAGKTTLVDVASLIATGVRAPRMFYHEDDAEMDKRVTALALAGEQVVLIDNVVGRLASPPLDAAVTSTVYRGRVLGKTEMTPSVPMKIVWWVTGNGIIIGADSARRAVLARLEPTTDRPEDRTGPRPGETWKYPRLLDHVAAHRIGLLGHALTVVKAYIQAGRPSMNLQPMGSFEAWSDTIRSAVVWAGGEDPCITIKDVRSADLQEYALRAMVECWPVAEDVEVTAKSLIDWAEVDTPLSADPSQRQVFENTRTIREMWRNALLEWLPPKKWDLPSPRELGYALRGIKGSIIENFKIEAGEPVSSGIPWKKIRIGASVTSIVPEIAKKSIVTSV